MSNVIFGEGEYVMRLHNGEMSVFCDANVVEQKLLTARNANIRVPYSDILDAYHRRLPTLPKVRVLSPGLRQHIRARWREDAERQKQDWWEMYFAHVGTCPFLLGENRRGWRASFSWLMKPENLAKVINDEYRDKKKRKPNTDAARQKLEKLGL